MIAREETKKIQVVESVFPLVAHELIAEGGDGTVVLDVRKTKEFETAHIMGAINTDYFSRLFKARLDILDKEKTYFVYCRMGTRSAHAQQIMKSLGFKIIYNIVGGILLWNEEGLPIATGRGPGKWFACPFSITNVLGMRVKRAFRFVYGTSAGLLMNVFRGNRVVEKDSGSQVRS